MVCFNPEQEAIEGLEIRHAIYRAPKILSFAGSGPSTAGQASVTTSPASSQVCGLAIAATHGSVR
jgi:hypothetical protein